MLIIVVVVVVVVDFIDSVVEVMVVVVEGVGFDVVFDSAVARGVELAVFILVVFEETAAVDESIEVL